MSNETDGMPSSIDYQQFQARPEFAAMRSRQRRFIFPLAVAFMAWFLIYVLLAAFAHDFMARPMLGLNVGLWLGLAQFATTFAITMGYVSFAGRRLDPLTAQLRAELEDLERGGAANGAPDPDGEAAR